MYDWNHNGKHDAFDDAMFMALLEDDLERHPPGKKHTGKRYSVAETTWADIGCFAYVLFFIACPAVAAITFLVLGEGEFFLPIVVSAIAVNYGVYRIFIAPPKDTAKNNVSKNVKSHENKENQEQAEVKTADGNRTAANAKAAVYASGAIRFDDMEQDARDRLDDDLLGSGYDSYDLEWMDEDERNEALWDNGLDPDDYEFE